MSSSSTFYPPPGFYPMPSSSSSSSSSSLSTASSSSSSASIASSSYPNGAVDSNRQALEEICKALTGKWEGISERSLSSSHSTSNSPSSSLNVSTRWRCTLEFHSLDGKILGSGISFHENDYFHFKIVGAFSRSVREAEFIKTHTGEHYNGPPLPNYPHSTHYSMTIDRYELSMQGSYEYGNVKLRRVNQWSLLLPTETANVGASLPLSIPMSMTLSGSSSSVSVSSVSSDRPSVPSPASSQVPDLHTFLISLFGAKDAEKYFSKLAEHEVDWEAFLELDERYLKELEFPLGPRLKILKSIKSEKERMQNAQNGRR